MLFEFSESHVVYPRYHLLIFFTDQIWLTYDAMFKWFSEIKRDAASTCKEFLSFFVRKEIFVFLICFRKKTRWYFDLYEEHTSMVIFRTNVANWSCRRMHFPGQFNDDHRQKFFLLFWCWEEGQYPTLPTKLIAYQAPELSWIKRWEEQVNSSCEAPSKAAMKAIERTIKTHTITISNQNFVQNKVKNFWSLA